ncbi:hypothetical protein OAA09_00440 [bacterium]|nr:hypothetical protein [bacterium]
MYRILKSLKDTYITNKIVSNKFRATDANVGHAGTLDLFKLHDENTLTGTAEPQELSRLLIKFDLSSLQSLTGSTLDITHSSFKCTLKLYDVYGGQPCPTNFKIVVHPLSKSFDEGTGTDVKAYSHLDSCNFITASVANSSANLWNAQGANKHGLLGSSNIDIISSGNLNDGSGVSNLFKTQSFSTGIEDVSIDITTMVSATIAGLLPDEGFRIAFSGTQETDETTRFVKRFASRHSSNPRKAPQVCVQYNDSVHDDHENMFFDLTGSLFLRNYHRGKLANIISGTSLTEITGDNSIRLKVKSGSWSKLVTGSQHKLGTIAVSGTYSASFLISSLASELTGEINAAGSGTFNLYWLSTDQTVAYHTGSIVINQIKRNNFSSLPRELSATIMNQKSSYLYTEKPRFRIHVEDLKPTVVRARKLPRENKSLVFREMYYQVKDAMSGDVVIPFDTSKNSTMVSSDGDGMYFDLYMDALARGRSYTIDFSINDLGSTVLLRNSGLNFRVD